MPHYKDTQNNLHFVEAENAHRLPTGSIQITDEEAKSIRIAAIMPPSADDMRARRDSLIAAVAWRYERHAREVRIGLTPTDSLVTLDAYVQSLADLTKQAGFPDSITWPVAP